MNELEAQDRWQRDVVNRLLKPVLRANAYEGQIHFFGCKSPVARLLQTQAHVDALVPLSNGGDLALELKMRRWPRSADGTLHATDWPDFFLETWSCSIPGRKKQGWMTTCQADFLLYCQCSAREDSVECYPLHMRQLQRWFASNKDTLKEQRVQNPINGLDLWTIGKLVSKTTLNRQLGVEGFKVDQSGLVCDLFGKPILWFMQGKEPPHRQAAE
jgi:hypothetical protein